MGDINIKLEKFVDICNKCNPPGHFEVTNYLVNASPVRLPHSGNVDFFYKNFTKKLKNDIYSQLHNIRRSWKL